MGKKDVGCIYNRMVLGHFYEMLFATTWLDLEGITVSSLGACTGSPSLAFYPVSRRGGKWVLPFYRLNVLDTNQKVLDISQGFIYMHITPLHQLHEFSRLDFSIKRKNQGILPPLVTTKPASCSPCLFTLHRSANPTWCAMSSSPKLWIYVAHTLPSISSAQCWVLYSQKC